MKEIPTRLTDPLTMLPAEYWEADGPVHGALADNVSVNGLLFFSIRDIPIGSKLTVRIFYANEYELDNIKAVSYIVRKDVHIAEDWKGYKYALKFIQMSEDDLQKFTNLPNGDSMSDEISGMEDIAPENPSLERAESSSPLTVLGLPAESNIKCEFYKIGKCLKTHAFCDLCQNEDKIEHVQERGRKSRRSSPFTSILSKLADNFKSTFQNH